MGYHGWEDDCDVAVECEACQALENTIENLKDEAETTVKMVTSILKMLYSKKFDLYRLESEIDELCYHLDIPMIEGDLQIEQKRLPSFLSNLIELNKIA